jgi:hypothetical protein
MTTIAIYTCMSDMQAGMMRDDQLHNVQWCLFMAP